MVKALQDHSVETRWDTSIQEFVKLDQQSKVGVVAPDLTWGAPGDRLGFVLTPIVTLFIINNREGVWMIDEGKMREDGDVP